MNFYNDTDDRDEGNMNLGAHENEIEEIEGEFLEEETSINDNTFYNYEEFEKIKKGCSDQ